jgi:hypothetical protein
VNNSTRREAAIMAATIKVPVSPAAGLQHRQLLALIALRSLARLPTGNDTCLAQAPVHGDGQLRTELGDLPKTTDVDTTCLNHAESAIRTLALWKTGRARAASSRASSN